MSGPAVSTRPARSCKAAADILSERDPVVRRRCPGRSCSGEPADRDALRGSMRQITG